MTERLRMLFAKAAMNSYNELFLENKRLFTVVLIKEKLADAYRTTDEARMSERIINNMGICDATDNSHLIWLRK